VAAAAGAQTPGETAHPGATAAEPKMQTIAVERVESRRENIQNHQFLGWAIQSDGSKMLGASTQAVKLALRYN
jgi:hypothetical protein